MEQHYTRFFERGQCNEGRGGLVYLFELGLRLRHVGGVPFCGL